MPAPTSLPLNEQAVPALLRGPAAESLAAAGLAHLALALTGVTALGGQAYQVNTTQAAYVLRFAANAERLVDLEKEERVRRGLGSRVTAQLPEPRIIRGPGGMPPFAVHTLLPGRPLTGELLAEQSPSALDRLVDDLARFFAETHAVPLEEAADWLGLPPGPARDPQALAESFGKPLWFTPADAAGIRARLAPDLAAGELIFLDETAARIAALPVDPGWMVFGHGDLHGFNMAITIDGLGAKFSGAFDLGCAGILDLHEDFFRLSLVSEDLLERVLAAYGDLTGWMRKINRDRIALYYRAFLFYLMAEHEPDSPSREHLREMLREHLAHSSGEMV